MGPVGSMMYLEDSWVYILAFSELMLLSCCQFLQTRLITFSALEWRPSSSTRMSSNDLGQDTWCEISDILKAAPLLALMVSGRALKTSSFNSLNLNLGSYGTWGLWGLSTASFLQGCSILPGPSNCLGVCTSSWWCSPRAIKHLSSHSWVSMCSLCWRWSWESTETWVYALVHL